MFPCVGTPMLYPGRRRKRRWILVAATEGVMAFGDVICILDNGKTEGSDDNDNENVAGGDDDVVVGANSGAAFGEYEEEIEEQEKRQRQKWNVEEVEEEEEESLILKHYDTEAKAAFEKVYASSRRSSAGAVVHLPRYTLDTVFAEKEQMIHASAARRISKKNSEQAQSFAYVRRRTSSVPNRYSKKSDLNLNLVPWLAGVVDVESVSVLKCLLDMCGKWHFDAFLLSRLSWGHPVISLGCKLFELYQFAEVFRLDWTTLHHCLSLIESGYHSNPYHNAIHAADVAQALHCFLQEPPIAEALTPLEKMACIFAAFGHDLYHPGVNQKYLENSNHHLCKLYKVSVLENFHWRCLVSIFVETSLFSEISSEEWQQMLVIVQVLILATDMQRQQEYLDEFKAFLCNHSCSEPFESSQNLTLMQRYLVCNESRLSDPNERLFIMQILIKCADIANPCRSWSLSKDWSLRASEEFFRQGDSERRKRMPVTGFCDRLSTTVPKIQCGFMEYVAQPLFADWHQFMGSPLSGEMLTNLQANTMHWLKMQEDAKHKAIAHTASSVSTRDRTISGDEETTTETAGTSSVQIRVERSSRSSVDEMAELETQSPEILLKRRASSSAALILPRGSRRFSLYDEHSRRVSLPTGYSSSTLWTSTSVATRRLYQALSLGQLSHHPVSLHLSETDPVLHEMSPETSYRYTGPPLRPTGTGAASDRPPSSVTFDLDTGGTEDHTTDDDCGSSGHCRAGSVGHCSTPPLLGDRFPIEARRRFSEPAVIVPPSFFPPKLSPPKLLLNPASNVNCSQRRGSLPMTQKELEVFRTISNTQPIGAW